jgi:hypothetical protein
MNPTGITTVPVGPMKLGLAAAVGLGALLLACIAFLAAATSPRTGTGLPMLAILVCGAAVTLAFYPGLLDNFTKKPDKKPVPAATPPAAVQEPAQAAKPEDEPARPHVKTIFDSDYPASTPTPTPSKQTPAPQAEIAPAPAPSPAPPVRIDNNAAIHAARTKLDSARSAVVQSLEASPGYQQAKADSDAADADLKKARLANDPGSPDLIAASQAALNAHGKLQKIVNDAMAKDPVAQDASRELQGLQSGK